MIAGNVPRHPPSDVHRRHQVADVHEPRLQLDHKQRPGRRMPRHDVDHPALAVAREGDFWKRQPATNAAQPAERGLVHLRMAPIDQSVEPVTASHQSRIEPAAEGLGNAPRLADRHVL
jgi:hypothetical protein